ncbi:hypothetical protein Tcan_12205 [Toxocara canis]|uniref:Uncharacterized protein n=1 Tax=Toxocara canis TaxID=6265 RepID=A0A0B2VW19_TOXCA|nr:hypothetical protein Tcan_12205 [Toxocara canis]
MSPVVHSQRNPLGSYHSNDESTPLWASLPRQTSATGLQEVSGKLLPGRSGHRLSSVDGQVLNRRRSNGETEPLLGESTLRRWATVSSLLQRFSTSSLSCKLPPLGG